MNEHYKDFVAEGHMIEHGDLAHLSPIDYHPFITQVTEPGNFVLDENRTEYWATVSYSPPPNTYGPMNWNWNSVPDYAEIIAAVISLKNETLYSRFHPYGTGTTVATKDEGGAPHILSERPHSFVWHPIHRKSGDYESEIVAFAGGAIEWDTALRNLLPEDVNAYVVVQNTCDQMFTYELQGPDALYSGEGDLHDYEYEEYLHVVPLDFNTNSDVDLEGNSGHCQYSMVRTLAKRHI